MSKDRVRKSTRKKKEKKNVPTGLAHVQSTFNNTIITITDLEGRVVSWSSSGADRASRVPARARPFAAQVAGEDSARKAKEHGVKRVEVYVKGPGSGARRPFARCRPPGFR